MERIRHVTARDVTVHPLRIGISARLMHRPPPEFGFSGGTIQYLDPSLAYWLMQHGAMAFMLPTLEFDSRLKRSRVSLADYVREIDGLVLQGGADVSPASYGEDAINAAWTGDRIRDLYEIDLLWECVIQRKPVLGICRGHQLINVAFGGTLYQDIATQIPHANRHVDPVLYSSHFHEIEFVHGARFSGIYSLSENVFVNSLHHQAVKALGRSIRVEAFSRPDGIVEAIRWDGSSYVTGIQWHPELQAAAGSHLLDGEPLLYDFLDAVITARAAR